jgi:hypothetical protein
MDFASEIHGTWIGKVVDYSLCEQKCEFDYDLHPILKMYENFLLSTWVLIA